VNPPDAAPPPGDEASGATRLTPYELVFTAGDFESRIFPRIRDEAAAEEVDLDVRERFDFLSTAGEVIREVTPEEAPPDAIDQYRAFLFHAYHFWATGRCLYVLDRAAARYLVEAAPDLQGWSFDLPEKAVYLQLPANLFWSSISPDSTPEPVDGFFVTVADTIVADGMPFRNLEILMVLGIHRARAGFSVIPLEATVGPGIIAEWAMEGEREGGDFANTLPGGEISGLYSILTVSEALKLLGRAFWYAESYPDDVVTVRAPEPRSDDADPPTTHLAYERITLAAGRGEGEG
jgi:hypothetical protein